MYIDEHVHLRDEEQSYKETIKHVLEIAEVAGVDAVFDVVNTNNPVTTRRRVEERLELAEKANSKVFYGLYFGITNNPKQIEECVKLYYEFFPKPGAKVGMIGGKMFAGESVGNLNLSKLEEQKMVYPVLSSNGYEGVLATHCGRKDLMKPEIWNPKNPITHSYARPIISKVESMKDQVEFALSANFQGKLHFFHVSSPEEVDYISKVKKYLMPGEVTSLKVSCEATPNHLFLFNELMNEEDGILLKVNPALRPRKIQQGLLQCLKNGEIDTIGTDHAPHSEDEKKEKYFSGIPGLDLWPRVARRLKEECLSKEKISTLTFDNQVKLFGLEGIIKKSDNSGDETLDEYPNLRPKGILKWI
ncbi:MAG: dihydroorotase [Candidatus Pacearchaeota archaeon]|jgi:dihydroorotase